MYGNRIWLPFLLVCLFGLPGCANDPNSPLTGKNLLLISIDTCRPDHLSSYGRDIETPTIQRLADEGVVFEEAVTSAPLTQPAHTSLFTGWYCGRHGVRDNANYMLNNNAVTLAECFRDSGYQTHAIISCMIMSKRSGLDQGFDFYDDSFTKKQIGTVGPVVQRDGAIVSDLALDWLKNRDPQKPFALFLHYYDPHLPYLPPEDIARKYPDRPYDGEIMHVDRCLGRVIGELEENGLLEKTLIFLVSDHGESLWEHNEQGHGLFLYDATMRIAFMCRFPEPGANAGKRINTPVSIIDVMPTLLDFFGLPAVDTDGVSLAALFRGGTIQERDIYGESLYPLFFNWSPSYSIRRSGLKYIRAPERELYDLRKDSGELTNLYAERQDDAANFEPAVEEKLVLWSQENETSDIRMSEESIEALAAAGYTGGTFDPSQNTEGLPDTKTRTEVYSMIDEALSMMSQGELDRAMNLMTEIIGIDPANPSPYLNMGDILGQLGRYEDAIKYLKMCLDLAPENKMAKNILGKVYIANNQLDEAEEIYDALIAFAPKNAEAIFLKGEINRQRGNWTVALEQFEEAHTLMPGIPNLDEKLEEVRKQIKESEEK